MMGKPVQRKNWNKLIYPDGVAAGLYNDPAIFDEELKRIWYGSWVYVGHESEIPNPHDFIMKAIGREPVLMTRAENGAINLLVNTCTHRGNKVCTRGKGNAKFFTCSYHCWTFASDGRLVGQSFPDGFKNINKADFDLLRVPRVASYGGFVFGSFAEEGPSLMDYLGGARETLDRLLQNSPSGEIEISAGFLKHKVKSNWKLLVENETDGYHPGFVHASIFMVGDSRIKELYSNNSTALTRDYGNGHTELDLRPEFRKRNEELSWFGATADRLPDYVRQMKQAYGEERARQIMIDGTPHVMIFPNLFIAEIQLFVIEPVSVNETIQHVTAIQFKGAPDINRRLRQQTMGSVGPAGFLLADDSIMYERTYQGLQTCAGFRTYIGRGRHREELDKDGYVVAHSTDDLPSRGIWRHYKALMEESR